MERITLRLPARTLDALAGQAASAGRTPADLARHLLNLALDIPDSPKLDKKTNPELGGLEA